GIVRAGCRHRYRRIRGRIAKRLAVGMPLTFPAEDAESGDAEPCQRGADGVGHRAEIFGDDLRAGAPEYVENTFAERQLGRFVGRREETGAAAARVAVGAIEA